MLTLHIDFPAIVTITVSTAYIPALIVTINVNTADRPPRYCNNNLTLHIDLPIIVTVTVNTTDRAPSYCNNNC
jgi:hypothetical protein